MSIQEKSPDVTVRKRCVFFRINIKYVFVVINRCRDPLRQIMSVNSRKNRRDGAERKALWTFCTIYLPTAPRIILYIDCYAGFDGIQAAGEPAPDADTLRKDYDLLIVEVDEAGKIKSFKPDKEKDVSYVSFGADNVCPWPIATE